MRHERRHVQKYVVLDPDQIVYHPPQDGIPHDPQGEHQNPHDHDGDVLDGVVHGPRAHDGFDGFGEDRRQKEKSPQNRPIEQPRRNFHGHQLYRVRLIDHASLGLGRWDSAGQRGEPRDELGPGEIKRSYLPLALRRRRTGHWSTSSVRMGRKVS